AGRARAVLDHDLLPEEIGKAGSHYAVRDVDAAARRERDDDAHRPVGIRLIGRRGRRDQAENHNDKSSDDPAPPHVSSIHYFGSYLKNTRETPVKTERQTG